MMDEEYEIEHSPLSQRITRDGTTVEVCIYRGNDDEGWQLEVVDQEGGSTVWDDPFPSDRAALREGMDTIASEGIASFMMVNKNSPH